MLKATPLNAVHRAMGAKMVDFAGWEMPLHYGSQIEEHHCVRRDAGMFDVSHMLVLDVLIVYFLSQDWFRLVVNAGTADKDMAWIDAWRARLAPQLALEARRDLAMIAVQGPQSREKTWRALPEIRSISGPLAYFQAALDADMMVARTGYTGEDGFEIMLPAQRAESLWLALREQGVAAAGLGARDTLRLEAGMNL